MSAAVIAGSLIAHGVGDYLLQSHYMATEKTKRWLPAALHAVTYALPFLVLTRSPLALLVIAGTHAVIDRYRLARYVVWLKNQVGPEAHRPTRAEVSPTGYPSDTPPWLAVWLLIIADNVMHLVINAAALTWLA